MASLHRPARRQTLGCLLLPLLALATLVLGAWLYLRGGLPQTEGTLRVPGLEGPVEIVRDAAGVPHIRATRDRDAFFALGYVHAQDRLWQMELQRRVGSGRLSEVLGEEALPSDRFLRTLAPHRAARAAWPRLRAETRAAIEAYAAGVNAWLAAGHRLPPEFLLLGIRPEPWTVLDSLVWSKMMAWEMIGPWDEDLLRARLDAALGPERAALLRATYPDSGPVIVPSEAARSNAARSNAARSVRPTANLSRPLPALTAALRPEDMDALLGFNRWLGRELALGGLDIGSNNWVVSGRWTASGLPLLANDPHLNARIPSNWYLAELRGDRLHVAGATLPGLPAVILGRNARIAWGATNLGPDVADLYVERLHPEDPNRYAVGEAWEPLTIVEEPIRVKGRDTPLPWAARSSRHGPLLSDAVDDAGATVALRWTALDPDDTTADAFLGLGYARDWSEFRAALRSLVAPAQNFVYADVDGHIGYMAAGRIPIRAGAGTADTANGPENPEGPAAWRGELPWPGWEAGGEWRGWIPFEELPALFDPPSGVIVTANNRAVDNAYPHHLASDWAPPYRAARIEALLAKRIEAGGKLRIEDMAAIQTDQTSEQARALLPRLVGLTPPGDARRGQALGLLGAWDGTLAEDSAPAAIYSAWLVELGPALFEDELRGDLYAEMAARTHPVFLEAVLERPDDPWCDDLRTPGRENCGIAAGAALDRALDQVASRLGGGMEGWRWGALHHARHAHQPFTQVAWLRPFFDRRIANGGDAFTVNVAPLDPEDLYAQHRAPSYRQIIDLGAPAADRFSLATGQSGHPLSPHYDDLLRPHQQGRYLSMGFGQAVAGDRLRLLPAAPAPGGD